MSTTTATEKPILFSAPMVRALLEGRKTMTRRVMKPQPQQFKESPFWRWKKPGCKVGPFAIASGDRPGIFAPYVPGDRLWVRESLRWHDNWIHYVADDAPVAELDPGPITRDFIPGIFMKRRYCRLVLELTEVRVERVQEITRDDVFSEGVQIPVSHDGNPMLQLTGKCNPSDYMPEGTIEKGTLKLLDKAAYIRAHYAALWDSINCKGSWEANPWVWVVCFRRSDA